MDGVLVTIAEADECIFDPPAPRCRLSGVPALDDEDDDSVVVKEETEVEGIKNLELLDEPTENAEEEEKNDDVDMQLLDDEKE